MLNMLTFPVLLLFLLLLCAIGTALSHRELVAVIIYSIFSTILAVVWIVLESPDLAITQAAVGVGVSSVLFFVALRRIGGVRRYDEPNRRDVFAGREEFGQAHKYYPFLSVVMGLFLAAVLLMTLLGLPAFGLADSPTNNEVSRRYIEKGLEETGAVNMVAGIILDYRAFDTLGEAFVLFSAMGVAVMLLLDGSGRTESLSRVEDGSSGGSDDVAVRVTSRILIPLIMAFGVYVVVCGHISPGGGFAGGSIIGAGIILYSIAFGFGATDRFLGGRALCTVIVIALGFYCLGKGWSFFMGANHLETGIPLGTPGSIFSGGLILPLNIAVGAVVACTMYGFYSGFRRGRI